MVPQDGGRALAAAVQPAEKCLESHCGDGELKRGGRYDVSGLLEAQFESSSNGQVLKNRLGITSPREMDDVEARALERAVDRLVRYDEIHPFTAAPNLALENI